MARISETFSWESSFEGKCKKLPWHPSTRSREYARMSNFGSTSPWSALLRHYLSQSTFESGMHMIRRSGKNLRSRKSNLRPLLSGGLGLSSMLQSLSHNFIHLKTGFVGSCVRFSIRILHCRRRERRTNCCHIVPCHEFAFRRNGLQICIRCCEMVC